MLAGGVSLSKPEKRARAAFQCTALIAVSTVVNPSHAELSDPPRRARTIITVGTICVKIMVKM